MPLRDHFRPPISTYGSWDRLHGQWPAMIVVALNPLLPERFVAAHSCPPRIAIEVDVASYERDHAGFRPPGTYENGGGIATAIWAPPQPTVAIATDPPGQDTYEVLVYDSETGQQLVAAVEIVSPANKDRPEHRRAFIAKCAEALLQECVCVAIVDLVTTRTSNLYRRADGIPGPAGSRVPGGRSVTLRRRASLDGQGGSMDPRNLGESPGPRPSVAHAAALASRGSCDSSRAGSQLRGDLPHSPLPVGLIGAPLPPPKMSWTPPHRHDSPPRPNRHKTQESARRHCR